LYRRLSHVSFLSSSDSVLVLPWSRGAPALVAVIGVSSGVPLFIHFLFTRMSFLYIKPNNPGD